MAETAEDWVAGARSALDAYLACLNADDEAGVRERAFHFPHVRFHSGKVTTFQTPADFSFAEFRTRTDPGWHHSVWEEVTPIDAGPEKVHLRVAFSRRRADDSVIRTYRSLYIVTRKDGRWGIQGRSSWAA